MAYRTNQTRVQAAVEDFNASLWNDSFLDTANIFTNRLAAKVPGEHTDEELRAIETYLAAHAYALKDPQYSSKSTGKTSSTFEGQTGMLLKFTRYGQMACALDHTGKLSDITSGKTKVGIKYVGGKLTK